MSIQRLETYREKRTEESFMLSEKKGFGKLRVVAKANANWGNDKTTGDPVHRIKLQVGYPDSRGNLIWKSDARFKENDAAVSFSETAIPAIWTAETKDRLFVFDFTRHESLDEMADHVHLKKMISFKEAPNIASDGVTVEEKTDTYVLEVTQMVEVQVASMGNLKVGPISLDTHPNNERIQVLIKLRTPTFGERTLALSSEENNQSQVFEVWYASPDDVEPYEYKAEVIVKGRELGQPALRWEGEWTEGPGSGPLVIEMPTVPADMEEKVNEYLS